MALQSSFLHLNKFLPNTPNLQLHPLSPPTLFTSPPKIQSLHSKNPKDSDLALEFSIEAAKLNTQELKKIEAFKKSKSLLFSELCKCMSFEAEDLKKKWPRMSDDDKLVLVKEFVSIWGSHFHPLSAKSVKELVDEYLVNEIGVPPSPGSSGLKIFPIFRKLMGFSED